MTVLLIANIFPPLVGGSAFVYHGLATCLGKRMTVLTASSYYRDCREIPGWLEFDRAAPYRIERMQYLRPPLRAPRSGILGKAWRIWTRERPLSSAVVQTVLRLIRETQADCVCLGELFSSNRLGRRLQRAHDIPVVQYVHGEELTLVEESRYRRWRAQSFLREADAVVAVSDYTRRLVIERGAPPERVHLVLNGVDTARFSPGEKSDILIDKHGLRGKKVILTVGRLETRKGQDTVIRALPAIRAQVPGAVYLAVGSGSIAHELPRLAAECGVEDAVVFAGEVGADALPLYYRLADVFAMPNRLLPTGDTEGFGLVFLEAGATGKPVVGGKAGGVGDAIVHGETGLQVDGNSVPETAAAIVSLLQDTALAARMGRAGRERAEQLNWTRQAERFVEACRSAVSRRARG